MQVIAWELEVAFHSTKSGLVTAELLTLHHTLLIVRFVQTSPLLAVAPVAHPLELFKSEGTIV